MDFTIIVPARLESTRLAHKILADINGEAMLVRVLRRAAAAGATRVLAATDSSDIAAVCRAAGFEAFVTTGEYSSGSLRVAAVAELCGFDDETIIVNLQGDEPFIEPQLAHDVAALLRRRPDCVCATVARPLQHDEHENNDVVKVVVDADGSARYFSRAALAKARAHLGVYAYRMSFLRRFATLSPSPLEQAEKLEQLRILWHGEKIAVLEADSQSFGIDTAADLERARRYAVTQDA